MSTTKITFAYGDDKKGTLSIQRDDLSVLVPFNLATDDDESMNTAIQKAIDKGFAQLADLENSPPDTTTIAANLPASKPTTTTKLATTTTAKKTAPANTTPAPPPPADYDLFNFF